MWKLNKLLALRNKNKFDFLQNDLVLHTKIVPWSTLLHTYKTTKKCIQFL